MLMKRNQVFAVMLIICLQLAATVFGEVQAQEQNSLDLQGITWTHPIITVQIVPQENVSWWKPYYINSTLRAIGEWNNAIRDFAANYSDFAYLSGVRMVPTVSNNTNLLFDVYVSWKENQLSSMENDLGLTTTLSTYLGCGTITNSTILLASADEDGNVFSEADTQNVALHELGHSYGLGHSNYTGDLMYPTYALGSPVRAVSTLDVYGIATIFQWMQGPKTSSVNLPSNIEYQYFEISDENLPPPPLPEPFINTLQTSLSSILQFVLSPEFLILILFVIIGLLVVILLAMTRRRRKEQRTQNNSSQYKMPSNYSPRTVPFQNTTRL